MPYAKSNGCGLVTALALARANPRWRIKALDRMTNPPFSRRQECLQILGLALNVMNGAIGALSEDTAAYVRTGRSLELSRATDIGR